MNSALAYLGSFFGGPSSPPTLDNDDFQKKKFDESQEKKPKEPVFPPNEYDCTHIARMERRWKEVRKEQEEREKKARVPVYPPNEYNCPYIAKMEQSWIDSRPKPPEPPSIPHYYWE